MSRRFRFYSDERNDIWDRDVQWNGVCCCGICGLRVDPTNWDADHIVPFEQGGETAVYNGQVTHPSCNRSKRNRYQKRDGGPNWTRRFGQELSYDPY